MCIYLRLDDDNEGDFIHTDASDLTMIVLGKTNLDSGLNLYDNHNQEIVHIKYVQNRAGYFIVEDSQSHLNFDNIDNGRLTLNCFRIWILTHTYIHFINKIKGLFWVMPYIGNNHVVGDHVNNFKVLMISHLILRPWWDSASVVRCNTIRILIIVLFRDRSIIFSWWWWCYCWIADATPYFVVFDTSNTIKLATSLSNAK